MISCVEFRKSEFKGRGGFPSSGKEKSGSRKWVTLSDGSVIRWWKGVWKFEKKRMDRKVATSLQYVSQMAQPVREVTDSEKYDDFSKFAARMVGVMGVEEFLKAIAWMKGS